MRWLLTYPEDGPSVAYYLRWVNDAGVQPTTLSADYRYDGGVEGFDALLLPGGGDVEPARYGATSVHPRTGHVIPARDELEIRLIGEFLAAGRPIFGICRGLQILNVALGGRLLQHVPDVMQGTNAEVHAQSNGYDAVHGLQPVPETRLGQALGDAEQTNSSHHQAVDPLHVAPDLTVAARSTAGIIEALECFTGGRRMAAVQWHPERLPPGHPASARLRAFFKSLV